MHHRIGKRPSRRIFNLEPTLLGTINLRAMESVFFRWRKPLSAGTETCGPTGTRCHGEAVIGDRSSPPLYDQDSKGGNTYRLAVDLLNPSHALEQKTHKLKRLVQSPNSYFMDVKCPGCVQITTVFSHAQTVVMCSSCANVLAQPTGGITRLTEGCSFRRKQA
ncbi:hypothetical protein K457DRAFT_34020 [Linnemannia elongata AG-77]|uniref:40S ribosomal protein S27 n=1 Tax=Linnemannia elongata AG-77 TaxID=1314771 RepID=A0A197JQ34_9FUNG|nr:hypothetical protein K457DRAFT_34020 [Linnemannia elongata AG-77]